MNDLEPPGICEQIKATELVVDNALSALAKGLNVDLNEITNFKKTLPIKPTVIPGMLFQGYAMTKKDEDGKVFCEFAVSDPNDKNTAIHEAVHWLHNANNPHIAEKKFLKKEKSDKKVSEIDPTSVLQRHIGLDQAVLHNLDSFSKKTGISITSLNELSEEELGFLVKQRLSGVSGFQLEKLSKELNTDSEKELLGSFIGHAHWLLEKGVDEELQGRLKREMEEDRKFAADGLSDFIIRQLKSKKLDVRQLETVFSSADIPLDTGIAKAQLLSLSLDKMSKTDLLNAIQKYLESGPIKTQYEALIALRFLPSSVGAALNNRIAPITLNEMEDIRQRSIKAIQDDPESFLQENNLKDYLSGLIDTEINKAHASVSIALDSFLFFGDLPDDKTARDNLLSNSSYVQAVIKMLMTSENSPLIQALGASPEDFAFCQDLQDSAVKTESSELFRRPLDIEVANFVSRESSLYFLTNRIGNDLAYKERMYWDSIYKTQALLEKEHRDWDEVKLANETQKEVLSNSVKRIEKSFDDSRAENDLFAEPIAHVITNLITGKPIDYGGSIMGMGFGGYDKLLASQATGDTGSAIEEWHKKIRKMIEKVKQEKSLKRLSEFFKANSIEEQKNVLSQYASL